MDDKIAVSLIAHGPVELANGVCIVKGDYAGFKRAFADPFPGGHLSRARYFLLLPAINMHPEIIDVTSEVDLGLLKPAP